jgi:hypothetical protein
MHRRVGSAHLGEAVEMVGAFNHDIARFRALGANLAQHIDASRVV